MLYRNSVQALAAAAVLFVANPAAYGCTVTMNTIPNQNAASGYPFSYTVSTTNPPDSRPCDYSFSFSLLQAPAGMSIDPWLGTIYWTPTSSQAGQTFPVTVQMEVDYTEPAVYTRFVQHAFNVYVWDCNSVDLAAQGQWVLSGNAGYRQLWFFASVSNPSPVCPIANVSGEVDEAGFPFGQPFTLLGTYSLSVSANRVTTVWSAKLLDEHTDPATFNYFMSLKPAPKWKNIIKSASAPDPNAANNQCSTTFSSTAGFSGPCL